MLPVSTLPVAAVPRLPAVLSAALRGLPGRLRRAIAQWRKRRYEHAVCRALRELDDRTLRDLGFDRTQLGSAFLRNDPTRLPGHGASP